MNQSWTSACDEWREAVARLCADDTAEPSAALALHLEQCAACRAEVDESRALAAELRSALRPSPLDTAVLERVLARTAAARPGRRVLMRFARWGACVAAAAALVLALRPTTDPGSRVDAEALTREAVDAIAATVAAGQWDASGAGVEALAEAASSAVQTLTATQAGERGLPWGVEDDWDLPSQRGIRS